MAIFDSIAALFSKRQINRALYEFEMHSGVVNQIADSPDAYLEKGYLGTSAVYSVVHRIDDMRKQAKLRLYKRLKNGEREEATESQLSELLTKVNSNGLTTDEFITQNIIYLLTIGEFFVYKPALITGPDKGKVLQMFPLPSNEVEIIEGTWMNPIRGYKVEGNYNIEFPANEVYHSKYFNPYWKNERSLHGLSPLRAASKTISKLIEIETTQLKQFENNGAPFILFKKIASTTGTAINANANRMTPEQQSDYEKLINRSKTQPSKRGMPIVVKDELGRLDLGYNLNELGTKEAYTEAVIAICNTYGMPAELFGYGQKTYNNMGTARKSAWTDAIIPVCTMVEGTFNGCLTDNAAFKDYFFAFDYSEIEELQEGMEIKVGWMNQSRWTGNEIRQATGKAPIDDELMNEPVIPMGSSHLSDYSGGDLIEQQGKSFEDYK